MFNPCKIGVIAAIELIGQIWVTLKSLNRENRKKRLQLTPDNSECRCCALLKMEMGFLKLYNVSNIGTKTYMDI